MVDEPPAPITTEQRAALRKLAPLVAGRCYLAGGVAVAAHLGHRRSHDLDLFSMADPASLLPDLERLPGVGVTSQAAGTLYLEVDRVPVSVIQYRYPPLIAPSPVAGLPVDVASIDDLLCMKLSAIVRRGAARDFWDLHAMVTATGRSLRDALDVFAAKHPTVDPGHVLRSLVYFDEAEAEPLPAGLDAARWAAIRRDLEAWVVAVVDADEP